MNGELLLVRHGKAGSAEPGKDDFYRTLTEAGKEEFTAFMKTVKNKLGSNEIEVWTSPLTRAKQTAAIFIAELKIAGYAEKNFLADGNLAACLKELEGKEPFRVACIGHEPFMSAWVRELTGKNLPFPKGGIMRLKFADDDVAIDLNLSPKDGRL